MPERINICCLFEQAPSDRRSVFIQLFEAEPLWMGQPANFMILNIDSGLMTEGSWPPADSNIEHSLEKRLLLVYSGWAENPFRFRSSISLAEATGRAIYNLSFPVALLQRESIDSVEQRLFHIYDTVALIGKCSIVIGPELELQPTESSKEAISSALDPASLAIWIIAPTEYLSCDTRPFEALRKGRNLVLLRHPDAARRIG